MSRIGRNEPCPCGSGRKFKRCCIEREHELARRAEAEETLLGLASLFPFLRPCSVELEEWAADLWLGTSTPELVEEGVSRLSTAERARIEAAYAGAPPGALERPRRRVRQRAACERDRGTRRRQGVPRRTPDPRRRRPRPPRRVSGLRRRPAERPRLGRRRVRSVERGRRRRRGRGARSGR